MEQQNKNNSFELNNDSKNESMNNTDNQTSNIVNTEITSEIKPEKLPENKILDYKRKISNRVKSKDYINAKKILLKAFNKYYPVEVEFLGSMYFDYSKAGDFDAFYDLLMDIKDWYVNNEDFNHLLNEVTKIYLDTLILKGNNNIFERNERIEYIKKNYKQSNDPTKAKLALNDDKLLTNYAKQALSCFEKAHRISPEFIPALNGLKDCYDYFEDHENYEIVLKKIENVLISGRVKTDEEDEKKKKEQEEELAKKAYLDFQANMEKITKLFNEEKNEEFLELFKELFNPSNPYTPLVLLKARVMARMRHFKESDALIEQAEKDTTHLPEVNEAKKEINELKNILYHKAAQYYLERALSKGSSFGQEDFNKAREALENIITPVTQDIDVFDMYYTVLKYLKDDSKAFEIKGIIYSLDPTYITSFDKSANSKLCFIASFAYSNQPADIERFRWLRREFLLNNSYGRLINCLYIRYSPYMVQLASKIKYSQYFFRALLFFPLNIIKILQRYYK